MGRNRHGARAAALLAVVALTAAGGCGGSGAEEGSPPPATTEPAAASTEAEPETEAAEGRDFEAVHVHGLGVDPADGALVIATHTGLWRLGEGEAEPVGESRQDTMGFSVAGPGRYLGSGHPDPATAEADGLPPLLGLIESRDGGLTWAPVSLLGEADFHVLRVRGRTVYGFDASSGRLLASGDRGATWRERATPGFLIDLVVAPDDPRRLVAAGERGIATSGDGGATWEVVFPGAIGFLAWDGRLGLRLVDGTGQVLASRDGRAWEAVGTVGGQPAALAAEDGVLYAARHDGSLLRSADAGTTWELLASL